MNNIDNLLDNMLITKPCNICKKPNNNNCKNICKDCVKKLTPHYENCTCIYCR